MKLAGSFIALPFAIFLAACSGNTAPPAAAGTTQQAIATTQPGPLRVVGDAFAQVPLAPEQRTRIEALFKQTETRHAEAWTASTSARKELLLTLASQVEGGAVDKSALLPKVEAAATPMKKARELDRAALVELHKQLTPEQRAAFVDALATRKHAMRDSFHGESRAGHAEGEKGKHGRHGHMGEMGKAWKELGLSGDQVDKIKDAMRQDRGGKERNEPREAFKARREELKKAVESFKSDSFSGASLPTPRGDEMIERMIKLAEVATPILTPEQRTKAAALLRERAQNAGKPPFTQ